MGPFAAALMQRFGVRPTLLAALALLSLAIGSSAFVRTPAQLILAWGLGRTIAIWRSSSTRASPVS